MHSYNWFIEILNIKTSEMINLSHSPGWQNILRAQPLLSLPSWLLSVSRWPSRVLPQKAGQNDKYLLVVARLCPQKHRATVCTRLQLARELYRYQPVSESWPHHGLNQRIFVISWFSYFCYFSLMRKRISVWREFCCVFSIKLGLVNICYKPPIWCVYKHISGKSTRWTSFRKYSSAKNIALKSLNLLSMSVCYQIEEILQTWVGIIPC